MTATTAPKTKRCPGFAAGGIEPHEVLADLEHFNSNRGNKDGLATRCKPCGNAYAKAWTASKKATASEAEQAERAPGVAQAAAEAERAAAAAKEPATLSVSGVQPTPQYRDELAVRAARGKAQGYTTETVGGLIYALPEAPAVLGTDEGQAALAAVNEARAQERRRRDAERKRAERAAKKRAEQEAQATRA